MFSSASRTSVVIAASHNMIESWSKNASQGDGTGEIMNMNEHGISQKMSRRLDAQRREFLVLVRGI